MMRPAVLLALMLFAPIAQAQELLLTQSIPPRLEWSYQAAPSSCTVPTPSAMVQTRTSQTGTPSTVATLPISNPPPSIVTYALPATANNLYYTVRTACGTSNQVQYVAATPPPTSPTLDQRVTTVETSLAALRLADQSLSSANVAQDTAISSIQAALAAAQSAMQALINRVTMLEAEPPPAPPAPTPTSNFTVTVIDANHIRVVCNGTAIDTTGRGNQRVLECIH